MPLLPIQQAHVALACGNPASASAVSFLANTTGHSYLQHPLASSHAVNALLCFADQRCKLTTKEDVELVAIRYALAFADILRALGNISILRHMNKRVLLIVSMWGLDGMQEQTV